MPRKSMKTIGILAVFVFASAAAAAPPPGGAALTGEYPNLFKTYLGKTDAEIEEKVEAAFDQLFYGDPFTERVYYTASEDTAYLADVGSRDVRSEGISYGMMITVQMDRQQEFNALWKWAKTHMQYSEGPLRGYFAWHRDYDGDMTRSDGSEIRGAGPAPDGENWMVMALFFASHRWGDGEGIFNYGQEAQDLLRMMIHKDDEPDRGDIVSMFHPEEKQIRFTPDGQQGPNFTDPSYHTPHFTELMARWAEDPADRAFLAEVTQTSRQLFRDAAHPETGIMANYTEFDGTPLVRWGRAFDADAWRTLGWPAMDWSWWGEDEWMVEQSNRILQFYTVQPVDDWPVSMELDGTVKRRGGWAHGLSGMAATAALAADPELGKPMIERLWNLELPNDVGRDTDGLVAEGELRSHRYYSGLLMMFGLLHASGNFQIYGPVEP
ncbi:glycosyl hydrolase family 8 [Pelagicoccus sp. SDUM812002]|uniref:glycosyl hydrolase family 8 n=1 Tax=Pelagicoccus sp. SDUM812002 TaxID=3041266 RepID=UPI0028115FE4|nr:glycosyl hydrolase family 8 [Pelagicoccus sp. SDUM812002]